MAERLVNVEILQSLLGRYATDVTDSFGVVAEHEGRWRQAAVAVAPDTVYVVVPSAGETVVALQRTTLAYDAGLPFVGSPARIGDGTRSLSLRAAGRRRLQMHETITPDVPAPFAEEVVPATAYRPNTFGPLAGAMVWLLLSAVLALIEIGNVSDGPASFKLVLFVQTTATIGALGLLVGALLGHFSRPLID